MKNVYTEKEINRMMSIEAAKILLENEDAIFTNTSYGTSMDKVVAIESTLDRDKMWYIGLERDRRNEFWAYDSKLKFVVICKVDDVEIERREIMSLCRINTYQGTIYTTDETALDRKVKRICAKIDIRERKERTIMKDSALMEILISKIKYETNKPIKAQELLLIKNGDYYTVKYVYRGREQVFKFKKETSQLGKVYVRTL